MPGGLLGLNGTGEPEGGMFAQLSPWDSGGEMPWDPGTIAMNQEYNRLLGLKAQQVAAPPMGPNMDIPPNWADPNIDKYIKDLEPFADLSGASIARDRGKYLSDDGSPILNDARQVSADARVSLGDLAGGFFPRGSGYNVSYDPPNSRGGFFSLEQLFGLSGRDAPTGDIGPGGPMGTQRVGQLGIPPIGTRGMGSPSTNNWRLLGMGPGWVMRNGVPIKMDAAFHGGPSGWSPSSVTAEHGSFGSPIALGTGAPYGVPGLLAPGSGGSATAGWPGAPQDTWFTTWPYTP